nr:unnamed protein product [Spirometra erinaceieuropaei]
MVERFHRQLKAFLRAADDLKNWTDRLPLVLLGICSSLKSDLDCSAAELVFSATVRQPGQMISPTPQIELATCSHVYLRCARVHRPLEPLYGGPFRVISREAKNFRIQRGTREEVVSVDRLKAAVPDTSPDEPCGPLPPTPPP